MNITLLTKKLQKFAFTILTLFFGIMASAQDTVPVTTSTKTTTTEEWYMDPTYLIIGGVVLIIVIALLVRGGGRGTRD
ncbi:MAG: hypothetical protein K0R36_3111 [Chryseobacterium sp.]|jgi:hypothetical protein|uniref:hypothetical protein n=1 Tax=Chryseobacterium sp. TaxID=1871047 RepID=UPI00262B1FA4|nr:hypothetical protein [Chryseobacterium sp.]MDF2551594.1 hypothetical protein [Chryseobacterium sp.]MDF2933780.1 hypothetical protein [Chryseobacterium sp.]